MIIPSDPTKRASTVKWIADTCFDSQRDRRNLYEKRRQFFMFGTNSRNRVIYNRLESHLDLVSAFLYSSDHAEYDMSASRNSEPTTIKQIEALRDEFNDDCRDSGLFDSYSDALDWALVFDTVILKMGWSENRDASFARLVAPYDFGVFREDEPDLNSQEAFAHTYVIGYDNAVQRLERAGRRADINRLEVVNSPFESPFPDTINRMIITATGGQNLGGNIAGQINPEYNAEPSYRAKVDQPLCRFREVTIWDSEADDYRIFHMIDPDILISDSKQTIEAIQKAGKNGHAKEQQAFHTSATNLFLPKDHPYVKVTPHELFDYFWGKSHIESLIPLQEWSNERLNQIHDLLDRQADPAKVFSGFMGLTDEKAEAFGGEGTWVYDQLPQAQVKELYPEMPPDLFADFQSIGQIFLEASGLTEVIAGKGEQGVRSRGHARELRTTGAGRIKKLATKLEDSLVRMGDVALKLKMKNDDDPIVPDDKETFLAAQVSEKFKMRIAGHSHSPLFADDSRELAALLFKAQAIDREMLIRLLRPPNRENMIAALRVRVAAEMQRAAQQPPPPAGGKARRAP